MDLKKKLELDEKLRQMLDDLESGVSVKSRKIEKSKQSTSVRKRVVRANGHPPAKGDGEKIFTKKYKSISRVDIPGKKTHGWNVRVFFKGKMHRPKFFSDKVHGGVEKALDKAIGYRNMVEEKIGKPRTDRVVVTRNPFNKSKVIGVRKIRQQTGAYSESGNPNYSDAYEVTWCPEPNVTQRTTVSIELHGEDEAFRKACSIRKQKEKEIYGRIIQTGI